MFRTISAAALFATLSAPSAWAFQASHGNGQLDNIKTCTPRYIGKLILSVNPDGRTMKLEQPYEYIDSECTKWTVPRGVMVDGASIPTFLWSVFGGPFEGRYRNASVIHDFFCIIRHKSWKSVHRMFYDAMITGGVSMRQAKIMYLAVYYAGPRWDEMTRKTSEAFFNGSITSADFMDAAAATVDRDNPSLERLAALAEGTRSGSLTAKVSRSEGAVSYAGFVDSSSSFRSARAAPSDKAAVAATAPADPVGGLSTRNAVLAPEP